MAVEPVAPDSNRPYAPPSNVAAILQRLRSRNLPERVDADYLRDAGVSEGTISRTLFALRFLGLVDGGVPTEHLREINKATDEEYRAILAGLIRKAYKEVFDVVDPAQDTQERILNVFRRYTPGSQRERMVVFFLGMCREAGVPTMDVPRQRTSGVTPGGRMTRTTSRASQRTPPAPKGQQSRRRQDEQPDGFQPIQSSAGLLFGVTEEDIAELEPNEFNEVWTALGKVALARANARKRRLGADRSAEHPDDDDAED